MPQQREQPKLPQPPIPVRTGAAFSNPFTGPLFEPVTMESAGRAASSLNNLLNPFSSAQKLAASAGGAMGSMARGVAAGEIPLMGRPSGDNSVAAAIPRFPSGAMGTSDPYPTTPQMAASAPTKFPYGSPLGPSIYSQAPTATTLTTGMYSPVPLGQSFAGINPAERSNYIPYGGGGTATMGLGGVDVNYPSRLGLMGGNIASGAISPLPVQTQQSLAAGLTPLAQSSVGIEGGPISLRGATAMTAPITASQQGRTAIQTPRGTIYATGAQQQALDARTTAYEGRTPAQQQALLAQMRERGSQMAGVQERFFAQKREELNALRGAAASAEARGVNAIDIMKSRALSQPSTIAGIRKQAYQYTQRLPMEGLGQSAVAKFEKTLPVGGSAPRTVTSLGPSGYALYEQQQATRRAAGITGPYSNTRAEQRKRIRNLATSQGLPPAYSVPIQAAQENYLRERGLL